MSSRNIISKVVSLLFPKSNQTPHSFGRGLGGRFLLTFISFLMAACSSVSHIPDGDQLYAGLKPIQYINAEKGQPTEEVKEEIEASLAAPPNGSLFGSSYYRSPFPMKLWIWNAFSDAETGLGKWITKSFGTPPVLMSQVNPNLRASVASQVLRENGFFRGTVQHEEVPLSNPKKAKIAYKVSLDHLFTLDTISYENFPAVADSIIHTTLDQSKLHRGDGFSVSTLDAERRRISDLLRSSGYYFYQPGYASYLADTLVVPGKVQLALQMADDIPPQALHPWYIGKVDVNLRKRMMERLNDSIQRRRFTIHFNGRRSPIRPRVFMRDLKLRSRQLYSYEKHQESLNKLTSTGLFSMVDFTFTPRDTTATCDTLDLRLNCVFDKPYDFYIETNLTGKTSGRLGPGLKMGFSKRNAFRGGEKLDINLWGAYEWQIANRQQTESSKLNSYEYGLDASVEYPRLVLPGFHIRKRFFTTPTTTLRMSFDVINRARYFKRHVVSGEWTYKFQLSPRSIHEFTPLSIQYDYMHRTTEEFEKLLEENPYLNISMRDQFIPKMRYTYIRTSPATYRNPIYWQTTVSEAGNILSLGYMVAGKKWSERDKTMFRNEYAQFFKIETDFRKTWQLTEKSQLVAHAAAGFLFAYGNSQVAPYSEQFYVGGANSIRAFTIRSIGPGSYVAPNTQLSYMDQTGDMKLLANLEYRFPLWGNLYGALFADAGNVWALHSNDYRTGAKFKFSNLLDETATATGFGLRYDLGYFVVRLDWGYGLHLPFETTKSGYFNIPSFHDAQSIHLAIGYPF